MARFSVKTDASEHLQEVFTKNIRVRMALYDVRQTALAEAMHLTQATLSTKLNRRTEWTVADIANAAVFFREPVENLVSASALEAIGSGSNYQLVHDAPVDNSQHELASASGSASAGAGMARYYRQPEGGEENKTRGAVGPRAFVMAPLDADLIGPGAMGSRFSTRSRFGCPRWDSNPHCADFEAASSTNWDTGACAQLWNCTT